MIWRLPSQRSHRKVVVVPAIIKLELSAEVLKGIKAVSGIKTFIILTVASLYLAIMPRCKRANQLMSDSMLHETYLENGRFIRTAIRTEAFGKFLSIICLNAFNRIWKSP